MADEHPSAETEPEPATQTQPVGETARVAWLEYQQWAHTSRTLKTTFEKKKQWAIALPILGVLLATIAGQLGGTPDGNAPEVGSSISIGSGIGLVGAMLLAVGGYFGRVFLTAENEQLWVRARYLAEALKREVWLYLMRVPPYDTDSRNETLDAKASELTTGRGLTKTGDSTASRAFPEVDSVRGYAEQRVEKQRQYYEKTWKKHERTHKRLEWIVLGLAVVSIVFGVLAVISPIFPALAPLLTTLSGVAIAVINSTRVGRLVSIYQETEWQLRRRKARWEDMDRKLEAAETAARRADRKEELAEERRTAGADFVMDCEAIMTRENESWRTTWMDEKTMAELNRALQAAHERAPAKPTAKAAPTN